MSPNEIETVAKKAARSALEDMFLTLGVDLTKPEAILAFQDDLRHARYMRQLSSRVGSRAFNMILTLVLGGAIVVVAQKFGWSLPKVP